MNRTNVIIGASIGLGLIIALGAWLLYDIGTEFLLGAVVVPIVDELEGTDTSWQTQAEDAGFGSYGPM